MGTSLISGRCDSRRLAIIPKEVTISILGTQNGKVRKMQVSPAHPVICVQIPQLFTMVNGIG